MVVMMVSFTLPLAFPALLIPQFPAQFLNLLLLAIQFLLHVGVGIAVADWLLIGHIWILAMVTINDMFGYETCQPDHTAKQKWMAECTLEDIGMLLSQAHK